MPGGRFELTDSKRESLYVPRGARTTVDLMLESLLRRLWPARFSSFARRLPSCGLRRVERKFPGIDCGKKSAWFSGANGSAGSHAARDGRREVFLPDLPTVFFGARRSALAPRSLCKDLARRSVCFTALFCTAEVVSGLRRTDLRRIFFSKRSSGLSEMPAASASRLTASCTSLATAVCVLEALR